MARGFPYRLGALTGAFVFYAVFCAGPAPAAVDTFVGAKHVVQNSPVTDCGTKAKSALTTVVGSAYETAAGTGEFLGYGPTDSSGHASYGAAIHCYSIGNGYVVTITCAAGIPPSPFRAQDLCAKIDTAFGAPAAAVAP